MQSRVVRARTTSITPSSMRTDTALLIRSARSAGVRRASPQLAERDSSCGRSLAQPREAGERLVAFWQLFLPARLLD